MSKGRKFLFRGEMEGKRTRDILPGMQRCEFCRKNILENYKTWGGATFNGRKLKVSNPLFPSQLCTILWIDVFECFYPSQGKQHRSHYLGSYSSDSIRLATLLCFPCKILPRISYPGLLPFFLSLYPNLPRDLIRYPFLKSSGTARKRYTLL